jgi:hypothetical protein
MKKMLYKNVFKLEVQVKENPLKPFRKIYEAVADWKNDKHRPQTFLQFLNILDMARVIYEPSAGSRCSRMSASFLKYERRRSECL